MRISTPLRLLVAALLTVLLTSACANSAWNRAMKEDTAVGYHRFLREYPDSKHALSAQERIDFLKLQRSPTLAAFRAFREKYPASALVDRLRGELERATFESARAAGTPEAYDEFVREFPDSPLVARADGNAVYLRDVVHRPSRDALVAFAEEHPESDFAAEAARSAEVVAARGSRTITSAGLVVTVPSDTPEARRAVQAFVERATRTYSLAGIRLVPLSRASDAAAAGVDALLLVDHREHEVDNVSAKGLLPQPGILATTRVRLRRGEHTIFERAFELRVDQRGHSPGSSVLFGAAASRFWADFFVPVATWEANLAVREPVVLDREAVAVDASSDRAVVLYEDGAFDVMHLADPLEPVRLAGYARETHLERFDGVRVLPEGVAVFGEDGLEVVGVGARGEQRIVTRGRGEVGSVAALERIGQRLVVGGTRGLLTLGAVGDGEPRVLMRRTVLGLARAADLVVLADVDTLFVSTLPMLEKKRVAGQLKLGKSFATRRIRTFGTTALVIGDGGVMVVDLRSPRAPRLIGRLRPDDVGPIADAGRVGSRIFLTGERGIQVLGPKLDRVVEVVDAVPGRSISAYGRHLVTVGGPALQVIDGMPFGRAASRVARPAKAN